MAYLYNVRSSLVSVVFRSNLHNISFGEYALYNVYQSWKWCKLELTIKGRRDMWIEFWKFRNGRHLTTKAHGKTNIPLHHAFSQNSVTRDGTKRETESYKPYLLHSFISFYSKNISSFFLIQQYFSVLEGVRDFSGFGMQVSAKHMLPGQENFVLGAEWRETSFGMSVDRYCSMHTW